MSDSCLLPGFSAPVHGNLNLQPATAGLAGTVIASCFSDLHPFQFLWRHTQAELEVEESWSSAQL